jgi:hypothetical protein
MLILIGQTFEAFHWLHKRLLFALMRLMVPEAVPLKIISAFDFGSQLAAREV